MKPILFFLLFLQCYVAFTQGEDPLYYFITKDSLVGVKNSKGKIIIPAKNSWLFDIKSGDKVIEYPINLVEVNDTSRDAVHAFGKMYNRKGEFLYRPYVFDNGPDYLREGLSRFIENGKMGFVDRQGKKVIPAQFDFVNEFSLGTAVFCMGCSFDKKKNEEHPVLKGGTYGMINKKGEILINNIFNGSDAKSWKRIDSLKQNFYTKEFQYTSFEKGLINKLNPYKKTIEKEYFNTNSEPSKSLVFEIVERPSAGFPYYVIYSMEQIHDNIYGGSWGLVFYVSKDGKNLYFFDEWGKGMIPFLKWYNLYSKGERDY
jgi:hypothetical protein